MPPRSELPGFVVALALVAGCGDDERGSNFASSTALTTVSTSATGGPSSSGTAGTGTAGGTGATGSTATQGTATSATTGDTTNGTGGDTASTGTGGSTGGTMGVTAGSGSGSSGGSSTGLPGVCGNGLAELNEQCDGADAGGVTCADLGFSGGGDPGCTAQCQWATVDCPGNHGFVYTDVASLLVDARNLQRVRWHPSGDFALLLSLDGHVLRYDAATDMVSTLGQVGDTLTDLDVAADGTYFLLVGTDAGQGQLWRADVGVGQVVTVTASSTTTGTPRGVVLAPEADVFAVGVSTSSDFINRIHLWEPVGGLDGGVAFNAGAGLLDVMWADPALYAGSRAIISSHGINGADSRTHTLADGMVIQNGWPLSHGNAGRAGWRPGGGYGYTTGWSTNRIYVFNGAWSSIALPGVGTAASPQEIAWKSDGTRAVITGRAIGPGLSATVIDHRAGGSVVFSAADLVNASISNFDQGPWFANSSTFVFGADWRPNSDCDGGLMVASRSSGSGILLRFHDGGDADCP